MMEITLHHLRLQEETLSINNWRIMLKKLLLWSLKIKEHHRKIGASIYLLGLSITLMMTQRNHLLFSYSIRPQNFLNFILINLLAIRLRLISHQQAVIGMLLLWQTFTLNQAQPMSDYIIVMDHKVRLIEDLLQGMQLMNLMTLL